MSLMLEALKRLEAKAPPRQATVSALVDVAQVESPASPPPVADERPLIAVEIEPRPPIHEPVVLESVEVSVAHIPADDWYEQSELCLGGPELSDDDVDVQIAIGALEGEVRDLDLTIKAIDDDVDALETPVEGIEDKQTHDVSPQPGAPIEVEAELAADDLTLFDVPTHHIDFAAELANLWDECTEEIASEPAAPVAETNAAAVEEEISDATISFGPLDEELLQVNPTLPVESRDGPGSEDIDEIAESFAPDSESTSEPETVPEGEAASESELAPSVAAGADEGTKELADSEPPIGSILPITDFRPQALEPTPQELLDDHDVLAAQLAELEYRGLRDNVLSQLSDAPMALLFAAADEDTDVADVVMRLADSIAELRRGDVAVVCSRQLRDSYRASPEYGELHRVGRRSARRTPTLLIDAPDAGDRLVADLKGRCRWVLFAADAFTARRWSPLCDATYVVVALGQTDRRAAVRSVDALEIAGGHVLGCVLTDVPDVA